MGTFASAICECMGATACSVVLERSCGPHDPAANAWSPIASMGTARYGHAAAVIDGLLYAIGGEDDSGYFCSGERYDPAANAWSPIASMGTVRYRHAAAAL